MADLLTSGSADKLGMLHVIFFAQVTFSDMMGAA